MQQSTSVPFGLVQTTINFQTSATRKEWQKRKIASPGSITEISFRTINFRAALQSGEITDYTTIRSTALGLDQDLENWREGLPEAWRYTTVHLEATGTHALFDGISHVYANNWIADAWNNWRVLRILVKEIILENETIRTDPDKAQINSAISVIRELSVDICISIYSFYDNPRELQPVSANGSSFTS